MATYLLVVPLKPPSKNDLRPDLHVMMRGRRPIPTAWLRYEGMRRAWDKAVRPPAPSELARGPRRLSFTRYLSSREKLMDEWNLVGGLNLVVVDLLVSKGWLVDDRPDCVEQTPPHQIRAADCANPPCLFTAPCTVIEILDLYDHEAACRDGRFRVGSLT